MPEDNQVRLRPALGIVARTAGAMKGYFLASPMVAEDERAAFEVGVAEAAGGF